MRILSLVLSLSFVCVLEAAPWGKDAELACWTPCQRNECLQTSSQGPIAAFGEACIRFHQEVISPADGPRSHFYPSSSQYTKNAMKKYGFYWGWVIGCDRLMRENSEEWIYPTIPGELGSLKVDPVP